LSNLGLSYALSLQEAAAQHDADRSVRQNLALVLALEGKFASAEEVARRDLDAKDAAANVAAIRRMIAQSNTWKRIQELDTKPQSAAKTHVGSNIE
jgi:Flp pilus assembly protein TadD